MLLVRGAPSLSSPLETMVSVDGITVASLRLRALLPFFCFPALLRRSNREPLIYSTAPKTHTCKRIFEKTTKSVSSTNPYRCREQICYASPSPLLFAALRVSKGSHFNLASEIIFKCRRATVALHRSRHRWRQWFPWMASPWLPCVFGRCFLFSVFQRCFVAATVSP